jgi:REP element-mobilizing transposase RayT
MPNSWTQNFYHAVFSTKDRIERITPALEARLYPFIGGIARNLGCTLYAINGMPDHVHLLLRYPSELSHSDMLRHIKSRSSKWIHSTFPDQRAFAWQVGYGGFTVSKSVVPRVEAYIGRQKVRHRKQNFETELFELLTKHGVDFDPEEVLR